MGVITWSAILSKEHRLTVFENRVLTRYLGIRGTRQLGGEENYVKRSFIICTSKQIIK
jgi:hypothetical protein